MPKTITTTVYTYDELTDERAKERARAWLRNLVSGDTDWSDSVTDDFKEALSALGFDITDRRERYKPTRVYDTLEWSLGYSQGDGAAFSGTWYASKCAPGKLLADRPATYEQDGETIVCPGNQELHRIAAEILTCKKAGLSSATIRTARGFFMSLESADFDQDEEFDTEINGFECEETRNVFLAECETVRGRFIVAARDIATMFYNALRAEYEYQTGDEQIAESLTANGYTFTADGKREG